MSGPIVLIDDDFDDQEIIGDVSRELLPQNPLRGFYNGAEGLNYLMTTAEQPFLIICDMNMPIMNGLELLRTIQGNEFLKSKSIPFVFLTTGADQATVQKAYDLGVQGFLKKPESLSKLRAILNVTFDFWETCIHPNHSIFQKNKGSI